MCIKKDVIIFIGHKSQFIICKQLFLVFYGEKQQNDFD